MIAGRNGDIALALRRVVFAQIISQEIVQTAITVLLEEAMTAELVADVPSRFGAEQLRIGGQIEMNQEINVETCCDGLRGIRPFGNQDAFRVLFIEHLPDLLPECTDAAAVRVVLDERRGHVHAEAVRT